jgi:hypothetical protein
MDVDTEESTVAPSLFSKAVVSTAGGKLLYFFFFFLFLSWTLRNSNGLADAVGSVSFHPTLPILSTCCGERDFDFGTRQVDQRIPEDAHDEEDSDSEAEHEEETPKVVKATQAENLNSHGQHGSPSKSELSVWRLPYVYA